MRGGLQLDGSNICSAAFVARANSSSNTYVLSAGHCPGAAGAARFNGGAYYGNVNGDVFTGSVDAERILNDPALPAWSNNGFLYLDPGVYRSITSYTLWSGTAVGVQVGKSGATTGQTRGLISSVDYDTGGFVPGGNRFIRSGPDADATKVLCVQPGDSGGSVFRNNTAYGIVSGQAYNLSGNPLACGSSGYFSFFGAIEYVLSVFTVTLTGSTAV